MTSGEPDFTKRMKGRVDHWFIKGVTLKDPTEAACLPISIEHIVEINHKQILDTALQAPTVAACLPISIENPAIAYDSVNDRFKVDIEALGVGNLPMNIVQVLSAALAHDNPVIVRLTDGSAFMNPANMTDRAARLVGVVYGSLDKLQQRATSKCLYVQLRHNAAEIDPRNIRALTSSDIITVEQATAASLTATVTQDAKDRTYTPPSTLRAGDKTVTTAGSAEALGGDVTLYNSVLIQAKIGNTGKVYVGNSTTQKVELEAGDVTVVVADNLNLTYVDVEIDGEGVNYIGS